MATVGQQVPPKKVNVAGNDEGADEGVADALSKEIFQTYVARSVTQYNAIPHPGDIAEPASLAAVPLPATNYPLAFPDTVISSGKLSAMQLEGCIHACTKHLSWLPNGERAGFFIGDGAGTGKGRQIAAVIIDSYIRGRLKSVWISSSSDLCADATRDLRDLGAHIPVLNNLQSLDKATTTPTDGVMFVTYATLTASYRGRSRLSQLIDWVGGPSFNGVLVFDEAHKSKNYSSKENQGTKVATAVVQLQQALPRARVIYASATGVSDVGNMAYMSRLGLFGKGSSFDSFDTFLTSLKKKGISFLELLAMELKGNGFYVARGLNFQSAEFLELEIPLTPMQIQQYDAAVATWVDLRAALTDAVAACGSGDKNKDPWRVFWSAQQRFFKLMCVSMKVPAVVAEAKAAIADGCAVVIGLQSTGEAAADALNLLPGVSSGWICVLKSIMEQFVHGHFPTTLHGLSVRKRQLTQTEGGEEEVKIERSGDDESIAIDGGGGGGDIVSSAAVGLKQQALQRIAELDLPNNFLDELIDCLGGKHAVAEMTGRKARVVRDEKGRTVYELRAKPESSEMDSLNIKEKDAFMSGKKFIAIVSDAASTGISLHADRRIANQRRRVHLTIELPWSADKAIQQLGRSHRSNQTSAPIYKLVFTDLGGERRFAAAVARRLQSLGALTRGDRRAASGLDLGTLNYDSPLGRKALRRMYDALVENSPLLPPGVKLDQILEGLDDDEVFELGVSRQGSGPEGRLTAAEMVEAIENLHASMRMYVDIMGIGLKPPPGSSSSAAAAGARESSNKMSASIAAALAHAATLSSSVTAAAAAAIAAAGDASSSSSNTNKDLGDVRRFLNRLLAVPVRRQRLIFNYFQLVLDAETRAARAAGTYSEGVSDLPGQTITRKGPTTILWTDPLSGLSTYVHTLAVDRGTSFDVAAARLGHESRHGDRSSFYRSARPMPGSGRHAVILALQKPGASGAFSIVRPNTGPSFFELPQDELAQKYRPISAETAKAEWEEWYSSSLHQCTHGPHCKEGSSCHVGKRLTHVTLLAGSVVRIWDSLERVLARHEFELNKADRTMRIVRVEGAGEDPELPLIGLRFPGGLLHEVIAVLSSEAEQQQQQQQQEGKMVHHPGGGGGGRLMVDAPDAVNERLLKKVFTAPKTVLDFFKPKSAAAAAAPVKKEGDGGGKNGIKDKRSGIGAGATAAAPRTANDASLNATQKKRPPPPADIFTSMAAPAAAKNARVEAAAKQKQKDGDDLTNKWSEGLEFICGMGIDREVANTALNKFHGDANKAVDWLFSQQNK